ncbi:MAG: cytochrome c [bacterium]|nr:cytochrome c [bacterium]
MKKVLILTAIFLASGFKMMQSGIAGEWKAPECTNKDINPLKGDVMATAEGKKTFYKLCAVCHGEKGKGDGIGGLALSPKPRNFTLPVTQQQTDGALFWKMTEGRAPMASYKATLTVTQRWQLVNFIRTFKK